MTTTLGPELTAARERVAAVSRELAAAGLVQSTAGNVSERVGELVAITPTSEAGLHLGIYSRHRTGAAVHTHAPLATALACVLDELPCVHYGMLALGGPVPVVPYFTFGSAELAAATVAALEGRLAALMANHGAITHGPDLAAAVENAHLLEWACTVYWRAASIGTPRTLTEADLAAVIETVVRSGYGTTRPHDQEA